MQAGRTQCSTLPLLAGASKCPDLISLVSKLKMRSTREPVLEAALMYDCVREAEATITSATEKLLAYFSKKC